jgi:hypothetical protein
MSKVINIEINGNESPKKVGIKCGLSPAKADVKDLLSPIVSNNILA